MVLEYIVNDNKYQNINQIMKQEFSISARLMHKLIIKQHVLLNDFITDTRNSVKIGDIVKVDLNFEEESSNIISTKMDLNIVFEDDAFLILNKPAGIAVHPSILHYEDSLSNGVKFYFESIGLKRKIRPVNRLDLNTSGLIVFAKNEYVQECLIQQMQSGIFEKDYIAIVQGHFTEPCGTINLPIARKDTSIIERCVSNEGQEAATEYCVLEQHNNYSIVKCSLKTGRTHQIRVHMNFIKHPIINDPLYGENNKISYKTGQLLHAYELTLIHPVSKEKMTFKADLPEHFDKAVELIETNVIK